MTKKVLLLLLMAAYFAVAYFLLNYFGISCVFLALCKIPCPGCGMTRALISVLNGDFIQAVKYNASIFFMPYVFAYIFFDFKNKIHKTFLIIIALTVIVNWVIKIILFI